MKTTLEHTALCSTNRVGLPGSNVEVKASNDVRKIATMHAEAYGLDPTTFIINYKVTPP